MTESLADILNRKANHEPPEIAAIKELVFKRFKAHVGVTVAKDKIVINAANAALAGALRLHVFELQNILGTKKKLVIRIG